MLRDLHWYDGVKSLTTYMSMELPRRLKLSKRTATHGTDATRGEQTLLHTVWTSLCTDTCIVDKHASNIDIEAFLRYNVQDLVALLSVNTAIDADTSTLVLAVHALNFGCGSSGKVSDSSEGQLVLLYSLEQYFLRDASQLLLE